MPKGFNRTNDTRTVSPIPDRLIKIRLFDKLPFKLTNFDIHNTYCLENIVLKIRLNQSMNNKV
jgi:hypothetical protein